MSGIYVEILIAGPLDAVWERTQDPRLHQQWDLRFSTIRYLPREREDEPRRFHYSTRIGFGLTIDGAGESTGTRQAEDGGATSALKFWSGSALSLIREGSGYWRYIPVDGGVRFLTWYDYEVRWPLLDLVFRPLIHWATAWSFDRLRLWIERGTEPGLAFRLAAAYAAARLGVGFVWLYHGLVPKVWLAHRTEAVLLQAAGAPAALMPWIGAAEALFGLAVLFTPRRRWPLWLTVLAMPAALAAVALSAPWVLGEAFNPVTLNLATLLLAVTALLLQPYVPSAARCITRKGKA
ncbi:MAG: DoxX-like family protein [Bryobacteraceae bacterium]|nr:DoxX-like family protein [Bryobacteraceae bacterium]